MFKNKKSVYIFTVLLSFFKISLLYAQKDIRVIAIDDTSVNSLNGPIKAFTYAAKTFKYVKSGDIIFDLNFWEPIPEGNNNTQMIELYLNAQKVLFESILNFCKNTPSKQRILMSTTGPIVSKFEAERKFLKAMSAAGIENASVPDCVVFAYPKVSIAEEEIESGVYERIFSIVKFGNTDLENICMEVVKKTWPKDLINIGLENTAGGLTLNRDLKGINEYIDENLEPYDKAVRLSDFNETFVTPPDLTIYALHSLQRDAFFHIIDTNENFQTWVPGYFLIILGIRESESKGINP